MGTSKDLYGLLGLPREAPQEDIRKAHRSLVREYHPDANPGDDSAEERFKEVQHAQRGPLGPPQAAGVRRRAAARLLAWRGRSRQGWRHQGACEEGSRHERRRREEHLWRRPL